LNIERWNACSFTLEITHIPAKASKWTRSIVGRLRGLFLSLVVLVACLGPRCLVAQTAVTNPPSLLLEASGKVELQAAGADQWRPAKANDPLRPGDRLRTGPDSRATLRLSEKSVIRVDQNTVLEITPPVHPTARSRFRLRWGALFFLNREKPTDIEFETPLATGAIRGTEFLLKAAQADGETTLALFDGQVELKTAQETLSLTSNEQARVAPGKTATVTAALPARSLIQWTLYYPGVLNLDELNFTDSERRDLADSLDAYRQGDLLAALSKLPQDSALASESARVFKAALELAVGRVDDSESLLGGLSQELPAANALRELIATVQGMGTQGEPPRLPDSATSSQWLARSYLLQSKSRLAEALVAARRATQAAPDSGFAWARVAELEFGFGHRRSAREALTEARRLSPRNPQVFALDGFISLDEANPSAALKQFNRALELDGALGIAWLGRGLAHEMERDSRQGQEDLQTAAALEPQRSLFRSYLGKGFSQEREDTLARKDFRLAKELDPHDPTPWLYSSLHDQQLNRLNDSVDELERAIELNDNRSLFRSRLLLDRDRAVASADLSAIYDAAGMRDVSRLEASRAVSQDYADFSGHLFLAQSLETQEDPNSYDLRFETPRQSELLVANLLAPAGGGNLSQLLSQQDHLQYFEPRVFGLSSLTQYGSRGDWDQSAALFGTVDTWSYAFDSQYVYHHGQRDNSDLEQLRFILSASEQVTPDDRIYAQIGWYDANSGDVAQRYYPSNADRGLRVEEKQEPTVYAGYHHQWSPGNDTLLLVAHLRDRLSLEDQTPDILFLRQSGGSIIDIGTYPFSNLTAQTEFELTSVELQHIWQIEHHAVIVGARYQNGSADQTSRLEPLLPSPNISSSAQPDLERANGYAYYQFRPLPILRLTAGLAYDYLRYPSNPGLPPVTPGEASRSLWEPKAALEFDPWKGGHLRAAYTKSLGGLYFDNSVRLEPAQLAGFTTAFRSLIPESVAGVVPGTEFETVGVGFDQSLPTHTYFGIDGTLLKSNGERDYGAVSNSTFVPVPDTAAATRQTLDFREESLTTYVHQLLNHEWSLGASYTLSQAKMTALFPDVPASAPNLPLFNQDVRAVLGHLQLSVLYNHPSGFYAQWHTDFFHQDNFGYNPSLPSESFWQHNLFLGYRFPYRRAEVRLGLLNLTDQDYHLNPLNLQNELPRGRTFTASLRLNF
jgi:Flp pilus assembly protein TadD